MSLEKYRAVIGLEVHAQLATRAKFFCPEAFEYGAEPNVYISPVSLGYPGALPSLNLACIDLAIKMGLATQCRIAQECHFARKNYFYPDLPKGYQITQDETPICFGGRLEIRLKSGATKTVGITRIHLEEDAGKSLHDQNPFDTLIDLNRAGVGLIEIVSEPDMSSAEEAAAYLTEIRKLVRYLDVCDGNMEEGSLRCDANISVMPVGATTFGTRVEVKNMNSISNVARAINYEIERQIAIIESGQKVRKETRTWDAATGKTFSMRDKESAADYRYFPEPDLQPLRITSEHIERIRAATPELPESRYRRYVHQWGLSDFDATVLTERREFSDYYEATIRAGAGKKAAANWMTGVVRAYLNETATDIADFPIRPETLAKIVTMAETGTINLNTAKEKLFVHLLARPDDDPQAVAAANDWLTVRNPEAEWAQVHAVLAAHPDKVQQYRNGKTGLLGFFVGQAMKNLGGKADPKEINRLVAQALES
jgi:aspartyl-tRNA(Asn)/glutamyl-tRNA(Gln) amidotransferase subunit B